METTMAQTVEIPARLAFIIGKPGEHTIKGAPGTHGDAGWTLFDVRVNDVAGFMARNASAAMPCWRRFENGKVVR
jgi:hypothetical protein